MELTLQQIAETLFVYGKFANLPYLGWHLKSVRSEKVIYQYGLDSSDYLIVSIDKDGFYQLAFVGNITIESAIILYDRCKETQDDMQARGMANISLEDAFVIAINERNLLNKLDI